jgi:hypothetical protein
MVRALIVVFLVLGFTVTYWWLIAAVIGVVMLFVALLWLAFYWARRVDARYAKRAARWQPAPTSSIDSSWPATTTASTANTHQSKSIELVQSQLVECGQEGVVCSHALLGGDRVWLAQSLSPAG